MSSDPAEREDQVGGAGHVLAISTFLPRPMTKRSTP